MRRATAVVLGTDHRHRLLVGAKSAPRHAGPAPTDATDGVVVTDGAPASRPGHAGPRARRRRAVRVRDQPDASPRRPSGRPTPPPTPTPPKTDRHARPRPGIGGCETAPTRQPRRSAAYRARCR